MKAFSQQGCSKAQVPSTRPAAQATHHLPSRCFSSRTLHGIQFFGVPCHAKTGSKMPPGSATLAEAISRHSSSVPWDRSNVPIFPVSPGLYWWLILHFQSSKKTSCHASQARPAPQWMVTAWSICVVLQQTTDLSGLHEEASERSRFRGRDGLTHLEGEKPKGFKYVVIIRHASNVLLNRSSGNQMKKANICWNENVKHLVAFLLPWVFCSWWLQPVNNHIINGFLKNFFFWSGRWGHSEAAQDKSFPYFFLNKI